MRKTLAVDFDGTLCQYQPFGPITNEPNPGASEVLNKLHDNGWKIIIHTCRARTDHDKWEDAVEAIRQWMYLHNIPFNDITAEKPMATAYIDDRALRFTNWQDIKNYFL